MPLTLTSPAFADGRPIPPRFTCDGEDVAPALAWREPPAGTRSFALLVEDPDAPDPRAPTRVFVHWVLYDLPAHLRETPDGALLEDLPPGSRAAVNDFGRTDWGGPCPPVGRHRYFFRLYALDATLGALPSGAGRRELEAAMQGHVLDEATLMGTYERR